MCDGVCLCVCVCVLVCVGFWCVGVCACVFIGVFWCVLECLGVCVIFKDNLYLQSHFIYISKIHVQTTFEFETCQEINCNCEKGCSGLARFCDNGNEITVF